MVIHCQSVVSPALAAVNGRHDDIATKPPVGKAFLIIDPREAEKCVDWYRCIPAFNEEPYVFAMQRAPGRTWHSVALVFKLMRIPSMSCISDVRVGDFDSVTESLIYK